MSKLAKSDVSYHIAKPDQDHCDECKWFLRPGSCRLVKGTISPQGWCMVYHAVGTSRLARKQDIDRDYVARMRRANAE